MSEGSLPGTEDRPISGCYGRALENKLFGMPSKDTIKSLWPLKDQEKTSFITPRGNYHYTVMSFGLKNAGATYQRMVTHMFKDLIGKTMEVYIDDMVLKTKESGGHACDLKEVFGVLRQHKLRLNAEKCSFGVGSSKFLGYMITTRCIEMNPG